jgi:hypothetical protein
LQNYDRFGAPYTALPNPATITHQFLQLLTSSDQMIVEENLWHSLLSRASSHILSALGEAIQVHINVL